MDSVHFLVKSSQKRPPNTQKRTSSPSKKRSSCAPASFTTRKNAYGPATTHAPLHGSKEVRPTPVLSPPNPRESAKATMSTPSDSSTVNWASLLPLKSSTRAEARRRDANLSGTSTPSIPCKNSQSGVSAAEPSNFSIPAGPALLLTSRMRCIWALICTGSLSLHLSQTTHPRHINSPRHTAATPKARSAPKRRDVVPTGAFLRRSRSSEESTISLTFSRTWASEKPARDIFCLPSAKATRISLGRSRRIWESSLSLNSPTQWSARTERKREVGALRIESSSFARSLPSGRQGGRLSIRSATNRAAQRNKCPWVRHSPARAAHSAVASCASSNATLRLPVRNRANRSKFSVKSGPDTSIRMPL
jgi:hypothetical protein